MDASANCIYDNTLAYTNKCSMLPTMVKGSFVCLKLSSYWAFPFRLNATAQMQMLMQSICRKSISGVSRAFPGGRNEEENEESLRRKKEKLITIWEKMRKVELLPIRDYEAGYDPEINRILCHVKHSWSYFFPTHGAVSLLG